MHVLVCVIKWPMGIFFGDSNCWLDRILWDREINNTAEREMKCLVIIICSSAYIL